MSRFMINATLFNVDDDSKEYWELKRQMVDDLTADEVDQPLDTKLAMLEDFVWRMFSNMEDDVLQVHYDQLKQDEVDPDGITDMFEPTVVEDK